MIGFLSKECDPQIKVKHDEIYFVSCPDKSSEEEIKMQFASKAKLFAEKFNLNNVYLHVGKVTIKYELSV